MKKRKLKGATLDAITIILSIANMLSTIKMLIDTLENGVITFIIIMILCFSAQCLILNFRDYLEQLKF